MQTTTGIDLMRAAYLALSPDEQDQVIEDLTRLRFQRRAKEDSATGRMLRSLRLAADESTGPLTTTTYRAAVAAVRSRGQDIESLSAVISHFGSWRQAREALELSGDNSAREIEARFARRRLDKVWRYNEVTLRETIERCAKDLGAVPQVADFEHWRARELELARARGDDGLHLPSSGPFRRRWGGWEQALLALGFTPDQVAERLEH